MWELDYKESWVLKNWCFLTEVLEKTLESPLDCKEIQPVYPKGNQSWTFTGRTDAEAETPILWPPDGKNWLIWRPWYWERVKAGGEGDNAGCDGWMASLTPWTWVWVSSGSLWWTEKPDVLQSMGSQWVRHNRATELNGTETFRCEDGVHFYPFVCIILRRWNSSVLVGLVDLSLASTVFGQNRPKNSPLLQPWTTLQHFF